MSSLSEAGPQTAPLIWPVSLEDPAAAVFLRLPATPQDLVDHGRRRGIEAVRFLGRRALLRHLVGRWLGLDPAAVTIGYDNNGRPTIAGLGRPLYCSVSARLDLAVLAVAPVPIGVDLEPIEPGPIPWSVLSGSERGWLEALSAEDRTDAFLTVWTAKEAFVKATGRGFAIDPALLDIAVTSDGLALRPTLGRPSEAFFVTRRMTLAGRPVRITCATGPNLDQNNSWAIV